MQKSVKYAEFVEKKNKNDRIICQSLAAILKDRSRY